MKKFLILRCICMLGVCTFLSSCMRTYNYVQLLSVKPSTTGDAPTYPEDFLFENEDCIVSYDFWGNGGDAGFCVYNKTDSLICIDLEKSFFIKNEQAYTYYEPTTVTDATTYTTISGSTNTTISTTANTRANTIANATSDMRSTGSALLFKDFATYSSNASSRSSYRSSYQRDTKENTIIHSNTLYSTTQHQHGISVTSTRIITIPPKSFVFVQSQSILSSHFLSCDLDLYPSDSASVDYTEDESPIHFGNYITYYLNNTSQEKTLIHNFYISHIVNHIAPNVVFYMPREICVNLQTPDQRKRQGLNNRTVYDRYLNSSDNTFYVTYQINSQTKAYSADEDLYIWSEEESGWVKVNDANFNPSLRPLP